MVAADRSGTTVTAVLPDTTATTIAATTIAAQLEGAIEADALLVTDAAPFFPPSARSLGLTHEPQEATARPLR